MDSSNTKKKYIIFEGIDGVGKTTLAHKLYNFISPKISTKLICEPGTTPFGRKIRQIISNYIISPQTQLYLFLAARTNIYESIEKLHHKVIILDRSFLSSFTYQTVLLNSSFTTIKKLHTFCSIPFKNPLVFIILAPVEVIRKRINNKDVLHKILSNKQLERISAHYKLLPTIFKNYKFVFLDGTKSIEELFKLVIKNVNVYLKWERKDEDCN